jgi:hypothetical protein
LSTKVNRSVKELLEFTGENITRNLVAASRRNMIEVSENDLKKVKTIIESSVEQSLVNGSTSVERAINETFSTSKTDTKKSKSKRK